MIRTIKTLVFLVISFNLFGQKPPTYIKEIYDNLYMSMSKGGITKPNLRIIDDSEFDLIDKEVATYSPINKEITIGQSFIELTRKFGKDSNNVRAHVISHELAHLFLNHGYVSVIGTGFASKEINKEFKKTKEYLDDKMGELEADQWAFFYSYIAGYKTNEVVPRLLDSIYKSYNLNDSKLNNYPPLIERKRYANDARVKMNTMCIAFDFANLATIHGDYDIAIQIYNLIVQEGFKSREIVSNLGLLYLLKALMIKDTIETKLILPIQLDMYTRMQQNNLERGAEYEIDFNDLIIASIDYFKQSVLIDPNYEIGYLNLSIAYWLNNQFVDSRYFLNKATSIRPQCEQQKVKVFKAIIDYYSSDSLLRKQAVEVMITLKNSGNKLASKNVKILNGDNKESPFEQPIWIKNISQINLPTNFIDSKNILDSTFSRDKYKTLSCKELKGVMTSRKWKYLNNQSLVIYQYFIENPNRINITEKEKNSLVLNSEIYYENANNTYLKFKDLILIIDSKNNIKYQIIKTL